jgi:hypothetical protein
MFFDPRENETKRTLKSDRLNAPWQLLFCNVAATGPGVGLGGPQSTASATRVGRDDEEPQDRRADAQSDRLQAQWIGDSDTGGIALVTPALLGRRWLRE